VIAAFKAAFGSWENNLGHERPCIFESTGSGSILDEYNRVP